MTFTREQIAASLIRVQRHQLRDATASMRVATKAPAANRDPDLPGEFWRDIPSFPGYQASNLGRVRGAKLMTPRVARGYVQVHLSHEGTAYKTGVGPLVLEAFGRSRPVGMVCRHLDDDTQNVELNNLFWGPRQSVSRETIAAVAQSLAGGMTQLEAAKFHGVSRHVAEARTRPLREVKSRLPAASSEQRARIVELVRGGHPNALVARAVGVSVATVSRIKRELGLVRADRTCGSPQSEVARA